MRPAPVTPLTAEQAALAAAHVDLVELVVGVHVRRCGCPAGVDRDDLAGWGQLGLLDAARRWRPDGGASLRTYAKRRIAGAIRDGLRGYDPLSRDHRRAVASGAAELAIYQPGERDDPLAGPLDELVGCGPDRSVEDRDAFDGLLAGLGRQDRRLLTAIYWHGLTQAEAARMTGLSESWACRAHAQALTRLRRRERRCQRRRQTA